MNAMTAPLSGLLAAQQKLEAAARNVANADTEGYRRSSVALMEARRGGVAAHEERVDARGPVVEEARGGILVSVEKSNVDLVQEVGELALARPLYRANRKTLEAQDEMLGTLLDAVR